MTNPSHDSLPNETPSAQEETSSLPSKETTSFSRRIRSFVRRQGRLTQAQQGALRRQWPHVGLSLQKTPYHWTDVFGRSGKTILEIGFGMGNSLATMAEENPATHYIGIEVHKPGVGALCKLIEEKSLSNIRIFNDDAIEVLEQCIGEQVLDGVYIFFPDPWHKKRHHKRRLIQPDFIAKLSRHLKPGGFIHLATDWEPYAEHMMEVMSDANDFKNVVGKGQFHPRPDYRPLTKFEQRGQRLGHGVWDLIFEKTA